MRGALRIGQHRSTRRGGIGARRHVASGEHAAGHETRIGAVCRRVPVFPTVLPITSQILDRARELLDRHASLMARDALHAAVVMHEGLDAICSYDRDFDVDADLSRVEP